MREAVDRIMRARTESERIVIFGDYDVDGVSSTALLVRFLKRFGWQVSYRLPHRVTDGYGLKSYFVDELVSHGVKLLITVDCGTRDVAVVSHARSLGMDIIITDHHAVPQVVPEDAIALLNPKLPGTTYPFASLSGSGVAFKLLQALTSELFVDQKEQEHILLEYIDLATLGTIADCMPLIGENRTIATIGLARMRHSQSPAIRKLIEDKQIHDRDGDLVGFHLGPRINAAGRMDTPYKALSMLLSSEDKITPLIDEIELLNTRRREETKNATEQALQELDTSRPILWYEHAHIEHGIIGLIAGRLANDFAKVSIVLKDEGEKLVGSARSGGVCDLMELLTPSADLFIGFGGHREAAGFSVHHSKKDELRSSLESTYQDIVSRRALSGEQTSKVLQIDRVLSSEELTLDFYDEVMRHGPYGVGFAKPLFAIEALRAEARDLGSSGEHISWLLSPRHVRPGVKAVGFGLRDLLDQVSSARVYLIGELSINIWQDQKNIQFLIRDIAPIAYET